MAAESSTTTSTTEPLVIEVVKSKMLKVETEKITLTEDVVNKKLKDSWRSYLWVDQSEITTVPLKHKEKTYEIQYFDVQNCVHMYPLIKMVFGEKVAAEWMFERSCFQEPVVDLSDIDSYLDKIYERMFYEPYLQVGQPENPYDQFKKDHGSLQDLIVAKVADQKKMAEYVNTVSLVGFEKILSQLKEMIEKTPESLKKEIELQLYEKLENVFGKSSSSSSSSSSSLSSSKRRRES